MTEDTNSILVEKLRKLTAEKGDSLTPTDLLIPELRWIIDCTALSEVDRKFAEFRYLHGMKAKDIMEELDWFSTKTFSSHNKKVWNKLLQTLHRLVD